MGNCLENSPVLPSEDATANVLKSPGRVSIISIPTDTVEKVTNAASTLVESLTENDTEVSTASTAKIEDTEDENNKKEDNKSEDSSKKSNDSEKSSDTSVSNNQDNASNKQNGSNVEDNKTDNKSSPEDDRVKSPEKDEKQVEKDDKGDKKPTSAHESNGVEPSSPGEECR